MTDRPRKPFHDAVHSIPLQIEHEEPVHIRDKDNAGHAPTPPTFGYVGRNNAAPRGAKGYHKQQQAKPTLRPEIDITKGDRETDLWIEGKIPSLNESSFTLKTNELPSALGLNGGTISKLEVRENGKQVAVYDRGWQLKPDTPQAREAVNKIVERFDPPDKEFKPIAPPSRDKDHDRGR
ncbi:hypothetical protein [uncultured Roseibium sp.]|uniref:DUF7678 domain-containing protein n=1 Tax=uncultured Roseibium sp. TaxID=1936171 RepID=UPI00261C781C|nr:hypothetical protein [uncultured Roseibium sp.]